MGVKFGFRKAGAGSRSKSKMNGSIVFDPKTQKPVIRCSICTGEQVAGFQDVHSGKLEEVCLIRSKEDLEKFRAQYGITGEIEKIY